MFVVNKEETQYLCVNIEADFAYFLFRLTGNGLTSDKLFFASDSSDFKERFRKFQITESKTEDLQDGTVSLDTASDLYCEIYNVGTMTLEVPESEPVWRGLWRVKRNETIINENTPEIEVKGYDPR